MVTGPVLPAARYASCHGTAYSSRCNDDPARSPRCYSWIVWAWPTHPSSETDPMHHPPLISHTQMPRALGRRAVIVRAQEKVVVIGLAADSGQHTAVADLGVSHLLFSRLVQLITLASFSFWSGGVMGSRVGWQQHLNAPSGWSPPCRMRQVHIHEAYDLHLRRCTQAPSRCVTLLVECADGSSYTNIKRTCRSSPSGQVNTGLDSLHHNSVQELCSHSGRFHRHHAFVVDLLECWRDWFKRSIWSCTASCRQ